MPQLTRNINLQWQKVYKLPQVTVTTYRKGGMVWAVENDADEGSTEKLLQWKINSCACINDEKQTMVTAIVFKTFERFQSYL